MQGSIGMLSSSCVLQGSHMVTLMFFFLFSMPNQGSLGTLKGTDTAELPSKTGEYSVYINQEQNV